MPRLRRKEIETILEEYYSEGYTKTEVAERTGHSRNTVAKYVDDPPEWSDWEAQDVTPTKGTADSDTTVEAGVDGKLTATAVEHFEQGGKPSTLARDAEITLPTAMQLFEQYQTAEAVYQDTTPHATFGKRLTEIEEFLENLAAHLTTEDLHLNPDHEKALAELVADHQNEDVENLLVGTRGDLVTCDCADGESLPMFDDGVIYCQDCLVEAFVFS